MAVGAPLPGARPRGAGPRPAVPPRVLLAPPRGARGRWTDRRRAFPPGILIGSPIGRRGGGAARRRVLPRGPAGQVGPATTGRRAGLRALTRPSAWVFAHPEAAGSGAAPS